MCRVTAVAHMEEPPSVTWLLKPFQWDLTSASSQWHYYASLLFPLPHHERLLSKNLKQIWVTITKCRWCVETPVFQMGVNTVILDTGQCKSLCNETRDQQRKSKVWDEGRFLREKQKPKVWHRYPKLLETKAAVNLLDISGDGASTGCSESRRQT